METRLMCMSLKYLTQETHVLTLFCGWVGISCQKKVFNSFYWVHDLGPLKRGPFTLPPLLSNNNLLTYLCLDSTMSTCHQKNMNKITENLKMLRPLYCFAVLSIKSMLTNKIIVKPKALLGSYWFHLTIYRVNIWCYSDPTFK